MFGVVFEGHPDLRRILMPEDYEGHPAAARLPDRRRTGDLHARRGQMAGGAASERAADETALSEYRRREQSIELSPARRAADVDGRRRRRDELLTLNFGPHHPATHGVLRLLVTLQGEVVRDVKPIIGYVHTGIEKTAEDKAYWKVIPVSSGWTTSPTTSTRWPTAARWRRWSRSRCPSAAQYLRVIHLELNRIASHLIWLGTSALDLGAVSIFLYCLRERELILDLFEMSSGRAHAHPLLPGRRRDRGHPRRASRRKLREFLKVMPERADEYGAILNSNEIVLQRLRGTCPLDAETLLCARRHRSAAARGRQPVGSAQGRPLQLLRGLRLQDPGRHGRRQLRPLRGAPGRDLRVGEDHRAGARGAARGPVHHRGPQGRAAAAPRAGDLDGGADPPLQARHRGLSRAARRGLQPDRVARAASSPATCARTAPPSPRACTCATPRSSTCRRSRRWPRAATSPT